MLQGSVSPSGCRTNLVPDGAKDQWGRLLQPIPSDQIKSGPIFELCKKMNPGFKFERQGARQEWSIGALSSERKAQLQQWGYGFTSPMEQVAADENARSVPLASRPDVRWPALYGLAVR